MLFCKAQEILWHKPCLPHWRIDAINHHIKPIVETIMDNEIMMQGMYEKARIAMVAKRSVKYGVLCTILHCAKTWLDCTLKEGKVRGGKNRYNHEVPTVADHASL